MPADEAVRATWARLSRDGHIGMSDAFRIVYAGRNTDGGRRALAQLLENPGSAIDADALSYLRISRDLPLPPGVQNHRADDFFRTRFYTGTHLSRTHRVAIPKEFLYFDFAIVMLLGTLDDIDGVRDRMRHSGYEPVVVHMPDGRRTGVGIVMINQFRDTTFGPYDEIIFIAAAVRETAAAHLKTVEYVNPLSLQTPLDRGAATYTFKLWLNELSPIDGGNDYLGTNKELGCFRFHDAGEVRHFRAWDRELRPLVSGSAPRTATDEEARTVMEQYRAAAAHAGTTVPTSTTTTIPVVSRPDDGDERPACTWAFDVDWRRTVLRCVTADEVHVEFGEADWARTFAGFGYTAALSFYAPSGVGQIFERIGDCPYNPAGVGT